MIESVLLAIGIILAVSGLCELIHTIRLAFLIPKKGRRGIMVIWLKSGIAAQQLKFADEQVLWYGNTYADHIIAVTSELSEEELNECRILTADNDIILCPSETLAHVAECISDY